MTNKTVKIWTAQMGKRHHATRLGIACLDITAKSGLQCFAPDYAEVMRYKRGETPPALYTQLYTAKMRKSFMDNRLQWEKLKDFDEVVFLCYCPAGEYCHRLLFLEMVVKFLTRDGIVVEQMGELI